MKQKILVYTILPVLALSFLVPNFAEAKGFVGFWGFPTINIDQWATRLQAWFQNVANILGITVDEVKNAWAEGKNVKQIMKEKGISQEQVQAKIKESCLSQLKSQLQALVNKGMITQEQADKRYQVIEKQVQEGKGCKMNLMDFFEMGRRGFHRRPRGLGF